MSSPVWQLLAASRWQIKATGSLANEEGFVAKPLSPLPGGERFGIDQLERGADSNQSGPCHVEIARRGNQARMTEEALDQITASMTRKPQPYTVRRNAMSRGRRAALRMASTSSTE